ncbi:MAG: ATP-dependent Clp protease proteolytic subunit, partial [Phocaeicola sp.]
NRNKDKEVHCRINSPGGSVNAAIAISKAFAEHGNVVVEFIGFCASCVTFMAFGAKKIIAFEDTLWLCHKCAVPVDVCKMMNSDEVENFIKKLENDKKSQDAIDTIIANKYFARCSSKGKTMQDVINLMGEDKWISAQEACDWGFIDEVQQGVKVVNEMREFMAMNCAEFKLPVLPTSTPAVNKQEPELHQEIASFLSKIFNAMTPKKSSDDPTKTVTNQTPTITMNKTYLAVNSLLKIEGLAENSGKIELTAEQLQAINQAIEAANTQKTEFDKAVSALDTISDNVKNIDGIANKVNAIKLVVGMIPTGVPAGAGAAGAEGNQGGKPNFENCNDPVNAMVSGEDND